MLSLKKPLELVASVMFYQWLAGSSWFWFSELNCVLVVIPLPTSLLFWNDSNKRAFEGLRVWKIV